MSPLKIAVTFAFMSRQLRQIDAPTSRFTPTPQTRGRHERIVSLLSADNLCIFLNPVDVLANVGVDAGEPGAGAAEAPRDDADLAVIGRVQGPAGVTLAGVAAGVAEAQLVTGGDQSGEDVVVGALHRVDVVHGDLAQALRGHAARTEATPAGNHGLVGGRQGGTGTGRRQVDRANNTKFYRQE